MKLVKTVSIYIEEVEADKTTFVHVDDNCVGSIERNEDGTFTTFYNYDEEIGTFATIEEAAMACVVRD